MKPNIYNLLSEYKLAEALLLLESKVESLCDAELIDAYRTLLENYKAYLRAQTFDPISFSIKDVEPFYRAAYSVNDRANRRIRILKAPNDQYTQAMKAPDSMFNRIWTSDLWSDDGTELRDIELQVDSQPNQHPVIITAVTLALFEMFDGKKLMYLFDAYSNKNPVVSLRALIGIILILRRYDTRIQHYGQITSRLSLLAEDPLFVKAFYAAHIILQYSKMTDSISDKMRNDIIPALLNNTWFRSPEMGKAEIDQALTGNGENPDWVHNIKSDKTAEKKIRQMAKLQTEGADIYMTSFRHAKSYPFFSKMQNWFEPFSLDNSELQGQTPSSLVSKLLSIVPFSDSDKYSFLFMIHQMGDSGSDLLQAQLEQQLPEEMSLDELLSDEIKDRDAMINGTKAEKIMRRYAQDLYRFYNLYPYRSQFFNPFDAKLSNFTPLDRHSFKCLTTETDEILTLAEFFMRKGFYQDALDLFRNVQTKIHPDNEADLMQKTGFCEQKLGNNESALHDLLEADSLHPDSHWTVLHISQVAFELRRYQTAIDYLDKLIAENPDDLKLLTRKTECLFALDQYSEAIPILYKVVYVAEDNLLGHQMLAWALLMTKSLDKSEKEYTKCLRLDDHTAETYLGHICVLQDNASAAVMHYQSSLNHYRQTSVSLQAGQEAFLRDFWSPVTYLCRIDINTKALSLLLESVLLS